MQHCKLIQFLRSLKPGEFQSFKLFVHSPFFNTDEAVLRLFDLLSKQYPAFEENKVNKEVLFAQVFPSLQYDDLSMRQLMHKLTKLIERFLVVQVSLNDKDHRTALLAENLSNRKLYPYFKQLLQQEINKLRFIPYKNLATIHKLLSYSHKYFFHPETPKFDKSRDSIVDCMEYLDQYFSLAKLQYASELITRAAVLNEDYEIWLLDEVVEALDKVPIEKENNLVQLYQKLLLLYRDRSNQVLFKDLKGQFLKAIHLIPLQDRIELYQQLSNYTIDKINEGEMEFRYDFFDLTKKADEQKIILDKNRITDATYTNISFIATSLKEFKWASDFITRYEKKLMPKVRKSATKLAWAYYHHHQSDYSKVLQLLPGS